MCSVNNGNHLPRVHPRLRAHQHKTRAEATEAAGIEGKCAGRDPCPLLLMCKHENTTERAIFPRYWQHNNARRTRNSISNPSMHIVRRTRCRAKRRGLQGTEVRFMFSNLKPILYLFLYCCHYCVTFTDQWLQQYTQDLQEFASFETWFDLKFHELMQMTNNDQKPSSFRVGICCDLLLRYLEYVMKHKFNHATYSPMNAIIQVLFAQVLDGIYPQTSKKQGRLNTTSASLIKHVCMHNILNCTSFFTCVCVCCVHECTGIIQRQPFFDQLRELKVKLVQSTEPENALSVLRSPHNSTQVYCTAQFVILCVSLH